MDSALLILLGESDELILLGSGGVWKHSSAELVVGGSSLEGLGGGIAESHLVSLLWMSLLEWEENQLRLVVLQSLQVDVHLLLAGAGSAVVNGDSDGSSELWGDAGGLELVMGESTAVSLLAGVPTGARRHNWAELLDWSWEHGLSLGVSALSPSQLGGWLVEVSFGSALPMLAKMYVWDDVVVLDHC